MNTRCTNIESENLFHERLPSQVKGVVCWVKGCNFCESDSGGVIAFEPILGTIKNAVI